MLYESEKHKVTHEKYLFAFSHKLDKEIFEEYKLYFFILFEWWTKGFLFFETPPQKKE